MYKNLPPIVLIHRITTMANDDDDDVMMVLILQLFTRHTDLNTELLS